LIVYSFSLLVPAVELLASFRLIGIYPIKTSARSKNITSGSKGASFKSLLARYKGKRGALIPLLQKTQGLFGYLPEEALRRIAENRGLSLAHVYGVATFYGQFRLTPTGRNIITVCHGTACHVAGAERISEAIERELGIKTGGTTSDLRFTLCDAACLGCCSLSPVVMINKTVYGKLTPAKIPAILKKYR
jgi:NADH-quinone oxidoreductase subunit E